MTRIILITLLQLFLFSGIHANGPARLTPQKKWQKANIALQQQNYTQALRLYKEVLIHCKQTKNLSGTVNALEAVAIVYKKQQKYTEAKHYCKQALKTGNATYRTFYTLAQIAYDRYNDKKAALRYCTEGLNKFPESKDLITYKDNLLRQPGQPSVKPVYQSRQRAVGKTSRHQLSQMEMDVIREMNLARLNPPAYARHLEKLRPYYHGDLLRIPGETPERTHEGVKALDEAISYLKRTAPLSSMRMSIGMSLAARDHVRDQSRSGKTGHIGGDGSKPYERMERYGIWEGLSGENIAYGDNSARMFVMKLIIDDGVPGRGHRDNIFSKEFRVAGASISSHPIYQTMCVITYASGFTDN